MVCALLISPPVLAAKAIYFWILMVMFIRSATFLTSVHLPCSGELTQLGS
jgi:hypothetical protein